MMGLVENLALSSDQVVMKLVEMGFEKLDAMEAVKAVGKSCDDAVEYILKGHGGFRPPAMRQSSLLDHFRSVEGKKKLGHSFGTAVLETPTESTCFPETTWEKRVYSILGNRFGISSLKRFQREALSTWVAHKDCLVLAATGSGKSLCFQIPALLTGKVVVVISPLISLMQDQCLKLSRHSVSACFLGSGQLDKLIQQKAMQGMYQIIYVCPETLVRLINPLKRLSRTHGIVLFAIDEAHCISKWGHDFRPHYRSLSVLRENVCVSNLEFLECDVPIMALTATATAHVQEDILESLHLSKETKTVLTSFFRPNLRFSVKHSRTKFSSSYDKDFQYLVDFYSGKRKTTGKKLAVISAEPEEQSDCDNRDAENIYESDNDDEEDAEITLAKKNSSRGMEMSEEYLEDETEIFQSVDDWDVACGEFCAMSPCETLSVPSEMQIPDESGPKYSLQKKDFEGPTIIYVPTRKESMTIAKYLCGVGLKAAAYNALVGNSSEHVSCEDYGLGNSKQKKFSQKPNLRFFISKIREHSQKFMETNHLWWKGLARIMECKGYIKELNNKTRRVEIRFIESTEKGKKQLNLEEDEPLYVYPEADMLVSLKQHRTYSGFSGWGKGWTDPGIRHQS